MSEINVSTEMELERVAESQVAQVTRYEKKSIALKSEADDIDIVDDLTMKDAIAKKKEINAHINEVKDVRMDYTRVLDKVKTKFTDAEKLVLKEAEEAKSVIGKKIIGYEEAQEKLRLAEEQRINDVISSFSTNLRSLRTLKAVDERGAELKVMYKQLPEVDQSNGRVKMAFTELIVSLNERKDEIRTAEVDEIEAAKAAAKRRRQIALAEQEVDEAEKAQKKKSTPAPKSGIRKVLKFKIEDAIEVPIEYCVPSESMIRKAVNSGVTEIPGVKIWEESSF